MENGTGGCSFNKLEMPPFGGGTERPGSGMVQIYKPPPVTLVAFVRFHFYNSLENLKTVGYTSFNSIECQRNANVL
jgi:hypothetical protein